MHSNAGLFASILARREEPREELAKWLLLPDRRSVLKIESYIHKRMAILRAVAFLEPERF